MTDQITVFSGGSVFDGKVLHRDVEVVFRAEIFQQLSPPGKVDARDRVDLKGGILAPGFVDLQVNGGGGVMLNDDPSVETLKRMAEAHTRLGVAGFLPTLITDTAEIVTQTLNAVTQALDEKVPGIIGLHLEGPHLSDARKGAHDARYIRPMTDKDVAELVTAKSKLPVLMVTTAPESTTPEHVRRLSDAGVIVALGHTDASHDLCKSYVAAGATCVTHLFNAMSQLGNREPGMVGLALTDPGLNTGLIADGVHVHPASMALAWGAKGRRGQIYLVSDAMAVAGTTLDHFTLNGRRILRRNGQLRLEDGTLAGADLDLLQAVRVLVDQVGVGLPDALAAATSVPGQIAGTKFGRLVAGETPLSDLNVISPNLTELKRLP